MGGRITIDCATLLNKGFELIEAHHLFGLPYDRIDVVVHAQSIVHGLIAFAETDITLASSIPALPLWTTVKTAISDTFSGMGVDPACGRTLHTLFVDRGWLSNGITHSQPPSKT